MELAGWALVGSGILWIFWKTKLDSESAKQTADQPPLKLETAEGIKIALPSPSEFASLLKAPYGAGAMMIIVGAVLLLADSGISISFQGSVPAPTPSST